MDGSQEDTSGGGSASVAPLASFLLFSYNQEAYIEAAMRAALAQTYQPLEIIVSDDGSPDGTYAVIERIHAGYDGPHTLRINRNPVNLGMGAHYDHVMRMARGEVFILAAGDDISLPERTQRVVDAFAADPTIGIVYSGMGIIDAEGAYKRRFEHFWSADAVSRIDNYLHYEAVIFGASLSVSRALFDQFGSIQRWNEVEDKTLIFRCLLTGRRLAEIPEDLVLWREVGRSSAKQPQLASPLRTELQNYVYAETGMRWLMQSYRQNLADLWCMRDVPPAVERALLRNLAETRMGYALWKTDTPTLDILWTAIFTGARPKRALKTFLQFRFTKAFLFLARKRRGAPPA